MTDDSKRHKTFQLKGYLRKSGYLQLENVLPMCRILYNAALQERRDAWKMQRISISKFDQMKQLTLVRADFPGWATLDVSIGRGVLCRADRAFQAFFRRVKAGEKPGFPRFQGRNRYSSIELAEVRPGMVRTNAYGTKAVLRIKGLPTIQLRLKRELPPAIHLKSLRINRGPSGVDVDLVYELPKETGDHPGPAVGIDMGVNQRLTISDATTVDRREIDRSKEESLRRRVSNSKKGSNRRRKRVKALAKECRRNRVRNRNECHRITSKLIRENGAIAVERLKIRNMTGSAKGATEAPGTNVAAKSGLNRSIHEQTWGLIIYQLEYKAGWAGIRLVKVDPRNTSRTCSSCGKMADEPPAHYRIFYCRFCGLSIDRDLNAASNIRNRAFGPEEQGGNSPAVSKKARTAARTVP